MPFDKDNTFTSGQPGTTGREPFEEGRPTGTSGLDGNQANTNLGGLTGSTHSGQHHHEHGSSGLTGAAVGAGQALGNNNTHGHQGQGLTGGHGHHTGQSGAGLTGDNYSSGGVGTGNRFDQTGNTTADAQTGSTHHQGHGHGIAAAAAGATGAGHHHQSGATSGLQGQQGSGLQGQQGSNLAGSGYDSTRGNTGNTSTYESDRVGALGQQSQNFERTGADGPQTHGAAGTDRFDSDRSHGNAASGAGFGPGGEKHTEYGGNTASGYGGENDVDKREKAAGTGGIGGILGTTDKEFTGRDRLGGASGAYGDEQAHFKGNSSGPGGNTALTGREGNVANNPVSENRGNEVHATRTDHGDVAGAGKTGHAGAETGEKKGIVEKIKDALH